MSRKKPYFLNNFSGGMTQDIRDTNDLSKCAYVSHFDIYRDNNQMYVMPGYIDDMSIGGDADGMKAYDVQAIAYLRGSVLYAVGRKSDGTGSKLFHKPDPDDAEWVNGTFTSAGASVEGTDNLASNTYLTAQGNSEIFYLTFAAGVLYSSFMNSTTVTDKYAIVSNSGGDTDFPTVAEMYYTGIPYMTKGDTSGSGFTGISSANGSTFTVTAKSTAITVYDIQTGGEQLGILGQLSAPRTTRLLLWDSQSLLADQNISMGTGKPAALGYPSGVWTAIVNEGLGVDDTTLESEANNSASMSVRVASGNKGETVYRIYGATPTNGVILPTRSTYRDAMLWYARIPLDATPTVYREGLWAFGKGHLNNSLAISVPFDTSSLGEVTHARAVGSHVFFIHGGDGSISRLDSFDSGTYDVPAIYESLVFGADSPYQKELNGISVVTENLPASASIQVYYRTDVDSTWVSMGTSATTDKQKHSFTKKSDATPIGKFQEIQFKIVATGKIVLKNITISTTETDDLPFSL